MNMALLLPAALTALVALIVPLILHIARRSEQQPTDFAALRWLRQKPRPRSRLRFDEWPLLLVRIALLGLAVLWLAQPVLFGSADRSPYVAVVPGASFDATAFKDSRLHWIAPGFPPIDQIQPAGELPIASLIRQVDAELPTDVPLTIVTPAVITGADADRLRLSRKVTWRITGGAMPTPPAIQRSPPTLSIRSDADHRGALRYIRGAALAWQSAGRPAKIESIALDAPLPDRRYILVWLTGGTLPDSVVRWVKAGGTMLAAREALWPEDQPIAPLWRDEQGAPLVEAMTLGNGRLLRFSRPLRPSDMPVLLESEFPEQLWALIDPVSAPTRVSAMEYAPVDEGRAYDQPPRSLRPWLAILIALLFLAERWLATRRRRSIAP